MIKKELSIARGFEKAELVLKNASIINVFTERVEHCDIAICNGIIVGLGDYNGINEIDCSGNFIAPGFIDGHIHLESTMLKPSEFIKTVLLHGTTAAVTDPHEIANVCGTCGIEYMMEATRGLPFDTYFVLPSCVPVTSVDENGSTLNAEDLCGFYKKSNVLGLAEVMDYPGVIKADDQLLLKIMDARARNKIIDGHAPGLTGRALCAYLTAGIMSDHECTNIEEAKLKYSLGQWIMIREGTAAKNLNALLELFQPPFYQRSILVTDDKHPSDLLEHGHIDDIIRKAVAKGADPCIAVKMATLNTAAYFGLKDKGAIAPGYQADLVILSDINTFKVDKVIKNGKIVVEDHMVIPIKEPIIMANIKAKVSNSFHRKELSSEDFVIKQMDYQGQYFRVIQLVRGELLTNEVRKPLMSGLPKVSVEEDILKLAVIERHHNTNHIGLGFVNGFGLKKGAIASSVAHDSHNLMVIGANDLDMSVAANCVREMQGGLAIALDGNIVGRLPLPVAGLMSDLNAEDLSKIIKEMKELARDYGVTEGIDPFMTLAFLSLPVIPKLRLITTGLYDVEEQRLVELII